ncbi:DNA replication ATP-dependent helicase/nuclease DNA2-like [Pollicipes pollicipes]|uniref:DNA replication ATP-dependent helicase/nuclease DNA2-like n=1 Tax=Pollicipes pollicipes TaxID=41117 RepID=UPI001884D2A9|nr:DNA replication ATP-dependent helicase/nuclease DNA2-like [Pollicipes pollicipes]
MACAPGNDGTAILVDITDEKLSPNSAVAEQPPRDDSALLFDSEDLDFSSPFKEEVAARAAPPLLRSADPSVPKWQRFDRYTVSFVERRIDGSTILTLQATEPSQLDRTITLRGSWADTQVQSGDVVHVLHAPHDVIDNLSGQLVVNPDRLISGTSVVAACFCARKAVLSELFRGLEPGNKAMLVGTLVHQLFQEVMRRRLRTARAISTAADDLLRQASVVGAAYGGGLSAAELADEARQFVAPILDWVRRYVEWGRDAESGGPAANHESWDGAVTALRDIEENYWSPRLGIKGKIDLTVEVKCRKRASQVLPLELKTGRPSFSAEHQGQVTLYAMMTSERRADPGSGLLLYLRTGAMREVPAGQHQQRDLLQLRNEMVHHLSRAPACDADGQLELPRLPPVIANERACQRCPHLLTCSAYQRPGDRPHAVPGAGAHLSVAHLAYFLQWSLLLRLEAAAGAGRAAMSRLWCQPAAERQARGLALAGCRLLRAERGPAGWRHWLTRPAAAAAGQLAAGDLVLLGTDQELALVMGTLVELADSQVCVLLDRDLTSHAEAVHKLYHVDKCEYQQDTSMGAYLSSLARLLEQTERSRRVRELLIDRLPPAFLPGLGRVVITKCRAILRPLNKLQQRALLRVMMAEDYLLIRGMPGTGKTSTIVALVRLLVTMGRSVLLASYTHSAVDTVLLKLKETFTDFVRLGRASRVHSDLQAFCSERLTDRLTTPEQLAEFYEARPVVATTCLGINHPIFQRRKFDICIIDEASQIVQPAALGPLLLAGRFVLVGDPRQLPPVIQSAEARRRGMDESLFSRLAAPGNTVELSVQYRMNSTLMAVANHLTYEGRLTCGAKHIEEATLPPVGRKPEDAAWLDAALDPALERALLLLDTSDLPWRHTIGSEGDVSNDAEAALVSHIAATMVERGVPVDSIGVIAPYRGQVKRLRAALPAQLEVNTVDQYQGRDKSVILYSCTRTAPKRMTDEHADSADILSDERRLTVAVTRARHKLVLVGRRDALASYAPFGRLFQHLRPADVLRLTPGQVSGLDQPGR